MKLYQIVVNFLEPSQAVVTIGAETQDEAVEKLTKELETQVQGLEVIQVTDLGEINPDTLPEQQFEQTEFSSVSGNIIAFPGSNTKH